MTFHSFANNQDGENCKLTVLPQEEGKNYMVLGNSFMIAFPPTFDFDKDQISFRVNPNAPTHTEINVTSSKSKTKWKFAVYFLAIFFLILLIAGILIAILQKNKRRNQHVYHKRRRA